MLKRGNLPFSGGVHPTDGYDKALTMHMGVHSHFPETVTILSEQSMGGKCQFTVSPGEYVEEGQLIGTPNAFLAAPLHSSVSGKILDIREVSQHGRSVLACIIKREKELSDVKADYHKKVMNIRSIHRDEILASIRDGGLTGMGGAGFPTHKKYETDRCIDALLINGAECEPFLTCDYRLMLEESYALINGVQLLLKASGAKQAYICLEDNKPEAAKQLKDILEEAKHANVLEESQNITVQVLPTQYPQGGERQLIQAILKREVPMGGLPADAGAIVSNVGTAKAAADMMFGNHPLTRRIVTVTGMVKHPGNFLVPVGTSAKELIERCGGVTTEKNRIIAGGPMAGPCVASNWNGKTELFYITKSTSGILVLPEVSYEEQPCIRCLGCENVCPAGLTPYKIEYAFLEEDYDLCEKLYASECIACGCCSFACPARRELSLRTRQARDIVKQRMRERAVNK